MNAKEKGCFLLLSRLGDPSRRPLSAYQYQLLSQRVQSAPPRDPNRKLDMEYLLGIGLEEDFAWRVLTLMGDTEQLKAYLNRGLQSGCVPISRASSLYPKLLAARLGNDAPSCLWAKGNLDILGRRAVSLVGSRDLLPPNAAFAYEVGMQAARQGYVLVSGNARGADSQAQSSALTHGGAVISVVADRLSDYSGGDRLLYLSEEDCDASFSSHRALSRNHVIHSLGDAAFAAQCSLGKGGTWSGTTHNLERRLCPVFGFQDGSDAMRELEQRGAHLIAPGELQNLSKLTDGCRE